MLYTLEKFGLCDNFIKWVKVLYNAPVAAVLTNGLRCSNFPLHRGNRQGDPLNPLLFTIAIEPLAQVIRQVTLISGILIGEEHKMMLYADDIILFLSGPQISIPRLIQVISSFANFSGYKIFIKIGGYADQKPFPFRCSPSGFVYLGIYLTPTYGEMFRTNFPPLLEAITADLDHWASLPLSWMGRTALIKMHILPRLLNPLQMAPILLSNKVIKMLEGWLSSFIWSKRRPRLKMARLQLSGSDGGLEVN